MRPSTGRCLLRFAIGVRLTVWFPKAHPMKQLFLALALITTVAHAQQLVSPEVHADGRVTFRLRATNATTVQVRGEGVGTGNMARDANGVWSFTSNPLEPDLYVYSFLVDSFRTIDPANPFLKYNLLNTESQVHVPGPKSLPWEINDVPRGQLHHHPFHSKIANDEREFIVYTPPGYDPSTRKRYPTFYLLHGFSDDQGTWTTVGRANVILDNLIARGEAKPMIVVMPLGYGTMEYVRAGWTGGRRTEMRQLSFQKFREILFSEVIPQVEKSYRIDTRRESRAIAGLSMGGAESLFVGLNAPEKFAWIGAFSSGGLTNFDATYPKVDATLNKQLKLLWMGCGTEDRLIGSNRQLHEWLSARGVKHEWIETGGAHSFIVWRRYLARFAPLLFQENKKE
jgi:enterochelin esterase-like enzyme